MNTNSYLKISGAIFGIIAALHALRLFYAWSAQIGDFSIPMWFSALALLVAGFLAFTAFKVS